MRRRRRAPASPFVSYGRFELSNQEIRQQGVTILLVEQNARRALPVSDYGQVMDLGKVVMHGKAIDLLTNDSVRRAYLGL